MAHVAAPSRNSVDRAKELAELEDDELEAIAGRTDGDEDVQADARTATEILEGRAKARQAGGEETPQQVEVDEIVVDGTTQLSMFNLGGKQASRASIKFTGGKVQLVAGEAFNKGDRIRFSGEAVVNSVAQKDEHDPKTSQVVDCEQRHEARIVDLNVESASA